MTHTLQLIEKVEFLLQLIAGTEAAESQTVVDICNLIGKVRDKVEKSEVGKLKDQVIGLSQIIQSQKETFDAFAKKALLRMNHELSCQSNLRILPRRACDCDLEDMKNLLALNK